MEEGGGGGGGLVQNYYFSNPLQLSVNDLFIERVLDEYLRNAEWQ